MRMRAVCAKSCGISDIAPSVIIESECWALCTPTPPVVSSTGAPPWRHRPRLSLISCRVCEALSLCAPYFLESQNENEIYPAPNRDIESAMKRAKTFDDVQRRTIGETTRIAMIRSCQRNRKAKYHEGASFHIEISRHFNQDVIILLIDMDIKEK